MHKPLFSPNQMKVLTLLFAHPDEEFFFSEIGRVLGLLKKRQLNFKHTSVFYL